ncbi:MULTISPECIES: class I SAM-dependent methyltransferase [Streptomyces]|uniref:class I SAM-dependent methyltransferase n=1 Tax=Streptomyces TaxID=1883 RepID=UPI00237D78E7|nr:class I SAM-dependent methyltransferase [Streptomyces sp. G7(2002)]WDT59129.1 class I SAM-dependent methyltransferase [Streptomyces sp. G7(2002)]
MSQQLWEREYINKAISSSTNTKPSHGTQFFRQCLPRIAEVEGPPRLLDLGCGGGRNATVLKETGLDYYGMDFAHRPLAKAAAREDGPSLRLVQGSMAAKLPYKTNTFSIVSAFTSVENVVENAQLRFLSQEIRRVLCPQGLLYVYFMTPDDGYYQPLVNQSADARSLTYDPVTELRQRVYQLHELCDLFSPSFTLQASDDFVFEDTRSHNTYLRHLAAGLWQAS